jgi:Spy/CpxP family protein refolding chaperone
MRKINKMFIFTALMLAATVFAFAQQGSKIQSGLDEKLRQIIFNRVSMKLNLSAEQKAQAKSIMETTRSRVQPLVDQLKVNREEVKNLGTDGIYNEQRANQLADMQSTLVKQVFIEKEKSKAAFFAILTPDQRQQAKTMIDEFGDRLKNRLLSTMME